MRGRNIFLLIITFSFYNKNMFNIYVDADSFPKALLDIVLRRIIKEYDYIKEAYFISDRVISEVRNTSEGHTALLRENKKDILEKNELRKIKSNIKYEVVEKGENSADDRIVELAHTPSFAITHDVPLSFRLCEKGLKVLDDRGHIYTSDNIRERLGIRNVNTTLREWGIMSEKTKSMKDRDILHFSQSFDALIEEYKRIKNDNN